MMNIENKKEFWFLLAISSAKSKKGFKINDFSKLDIPEDLGMVFSELFPVLSELKNKNMISSKIYGFETYFNLTVEGKRKLREYAHNNGNEYDELIRVLPDLEIKQRIQTIESFIFGTVLFWISYTTLTNQTLNIARLNFLWAMAFLFSFAFAGTCFVKITSYVLESMKITVLTGLYDFLEDNKDKIGIIVAVVLTIIAVWVLKSYYKVTNQNLAIALIIEIVFIVWTNIIKITEWLRNKGWVDKIKNKIKR